MLDMYPHRSHMPCTGSLASFLIDKFSPDNIMSIMARGRIASRSLMKARAYPRYALKKLNS